MCVCVCVCMCVCIYIIIGGGPRFLANQRTYSTCQSLWTAGSIDIGLAATLFRRRGSVHRASLITSEIK